MRNTENFVFRDTKKTVIFIHKANSFIIDKSVTAGAFFIKLAKEEWKENGESVLYYYGRMKAAAKSDKKYIIMEYEAAIGEIIDELLQAPGQYNFCRWLFYAFFHADTCPEGSEQSTMYNTNDDKMDVLCQMYGFPFISAHTIPVGYTLTVFDLQRLYKDFSPPETVEELEELFKNPKKDPVFPFYEADYEKLKEYAKRKRAICTLS
jgi:hypothetical protein